MGLGVEGSKGELILAKAVELADRRGMDSLSIRRLAGELGGGAMSIYHYFDSKEAIVDGMVDLVFGEIELPPPDREWKEAIRIRCRSAREALRRHPWAPPYMESRRNPGPRMLRHHDGVIGCFLRAGFSFEKTARAVAVTDAFLFGFAVQEASLPGGGGDEMVGMGREMVDGVFTGYPNLRELTRYVMNSDYSFPDIFAYGLDLILDGLESE